MRNLVRFLVIIAFLFTTGGVALAQGATASLAGTVTSGGQALPGATVTASSTALQGSRVKVTGDGGGYSFPALPPGDYTVTFELAGMQTVAQKVRLILAQPTRADADLKVSAVTEALTVRGTAPPVLETTQIATNFTSKEIGQLPVARTIRDTVLLAPGVSPNGVNNQITISGAPSYDSVFLVNGVVVNENLRGQPHSLFIEDAIQETTVLAGGISAEYGRFTGGVVSTLTKSGSNRFHGSFRDSFSNPDWTEKTPWPTEADHVDHVDQIFEGTLGGRILRDRLWFFAAGRLAERSVQRFTAFTNIAYENAFDEKRYEGKLTGQITSNHSVVASFLDLTNDETNNAFTPIMDVDSIVPQRGLPNSLIAFNYSGVLTRNLFLEGQYSEKDFAFEGSGGRFTDRIRGTWISDNVRGGAFFNAPVFCGVCTDEERNNKSWLGKASYYLNTPTLGSHNIVLGVENFFEERISNNYQSASQYQVTTGVVTIDGTNLYPRFDSTTNIVWRPIFVVSPGTDLETFSVFLNDKWDLGSHFSFNVGLRYDENDAVDASGNPVSDDSAFSPRLGIAWDIGGDSRHRIAATAGRYTSKIADGSNVFSTSQAAGNPAAFTFSYGGPVINPAGTPTNQLLNPQQALTQLFAWFDSVGGTSATQFMIGSSVPGLAARFEESLTSPSVDEFTIGYGTRIGNNAYVKADFITRDWNNFYAGRLNLSTGQSLDAFGNRGDVAVTENDDGSIKRKYNGVQFQAQWTPKRFLVGATYTYSELKGNDDGEGGGTATIRNLPLETWYPEYQGYPNRKPEGWLGQDQRHRARLWIGYDLPTPVGDFNVSLLQNYDTGTPYSAIGSIDATGRTGGTAYPGLITNPGYTLSQAGTSHAYYFGNRGEFRTENVSSTDIALGYSIRIKGVELFLRGAVTNVFDEDAIINPNTNVITRRTGGSASGLSPFNPFTQTPVECTAPTGTACPAGAHWRKGPDFGRASGVSAYQAPRSYGFGAGFRF